MKNLFVVIINYKTPDLLKQCLESILKINPELQDKILVIDNNSEDGSEKMLNEEFPKKLSILRNTKTILDLIN